MAKKQGTERTEPEVKAEPSETPEPSAERSPGSSAADAAEVAQAILKAPVSVPEPAEPVAPETPSVGSETDDHGVPFDPARHLKRKRKDGGWVKKPSGRRPGVRSHQQASGPQRPVQSGPATGPWPTTMPGSEPERKGPVPEAGPSEDAHELARVVVANMGVACAVTFGSAKWLPRKEEEEHLHKAWARFFDYHGIGGEMSPNAALLMACATYFTSRMTEPECLAGVGARIKQARDWWTERSRVKPIRPEGSDASDAQSDSGANGKREEQPLKRADGHLPRDGDSLHRIHPDLQ